MAVNLTLGNTQSSSSDITVAAGTPVSIYLVPAAGQQLTGSMVLYIEKKDAGGNYYRYARMTGDSPPMNLHGVGVWRVTRPAQNDSFSVESYQ